MMRNRKNNRRFRYRSNDRSNGRIHKPRVNGGETVRLGSNSFSNGRVRNNLNAQHNPEKLVEKYNILSKEALSSGDKILSETYSQHADHFMRILKEKALNQSKIKTNHVPKVEEQKPSENEGDKQDQSIEEKK
mgnify:CR=1 FL=1